MPSTTCRAGVSRLRLAGQPTGPAGQLAARLALFSDSGRLAAAGGAGADVILEIGEGLPHVSQLLLGAPGPAEATERSGKLPPTRVRLPDSP